MTDPAVIGNDTDPSARVASPETPGVSLRAVRASVKPESSFTAVEPPRTSGTEATGAGIFDSDDEDTVCTFGVAAWAEEIPNAAPPRTRAPVVARVMEVLRLLRIVISPLLLSRSARLLCARRTHPWWGGEPAMCGW
ncbi:hypothetical protein NYS55_06245 [Curtobacterium flaccumfaciens pv. flaccumfaciens]|uniref:hypothetical protein n=1 Tax=Curtobacterium flaccumfaciens TaxID=2035 RepID=UPI00217D9983|nr:hypothetical protein [Curtobacterium flaccumfaciens]MCS6551023.1 hypothetical protein [Curtobacterium flaccumfaciens pv. flaccumfaciens]